MVRFALMRLLLLTPVGALTPLVWHCVSQPAPGVADDESIARRRTPALPRPWHAGTVETAPSPLLRCLSRPRQAALRAPAAGYRWVLEPPPARGAAGVRPG